MKNATYLLLTITFLCMHQVIYGQYNYCYDAIPMFCTQSHQGDNIYANDTPIEDCFNPGNGTLRQTVWFRVVGDGSSMTASTCGALTDFDTRISVYEAPCTDSLATNLNCVTENDDACGLQSVATWTTVPGTAYLVAVYGYLNATGNFQLDITCANTPCPNSVSVSSNGPLCSGENAAYLIGPSPGANPTPGGLVYYTLDGTPGFIYLDNNGQEVIEVLNPPVGVPGSIITLDEIRSQNNLCPLTLSNGASVTVVEAPEVTFFDWITPNPACEGESQLILTQGTPGATVMDNLNGAINTYTLNANGEDTGSTGFVPGTWTATLVSVEKDGCVVDLSTEPSVTYVVNEAPELTSFYTTGGNSVLKDEFCEGENVYFYFIGTPNAVVHMHVPGLGAWNHLISSSGTGGFTAGPTVSSTIVVDSISLNGCVVDLSAETPFPFTTTPAPEVLSAYSAAYNNTTTNFDPTSTFCEGESVSYVFTATPLSTVYFTDQDGLQNNVFIPDSYGAAFTFTNAQAGDFIQMDSVVIDDCITDLSTEAPIAITIATPTVTVIPDESIVCDAANPLSGDDVSRDFTGTANAEIYYTVTGFNFPQTLSTTLDANGEGTISFVAGITSPGSYVLTVDSITLGSCVVDGSAISPSEIIKGPYVTNDDCSAAIAMSCGDTEFGNITCAAFQSIPDCAYGGTYGFQALWYSFIGDGSTINATTCSSTTDFDVNVAIYSGDCNTLICEVNDNDGCGTTDGPAVAVLNTTPGVIYYIAVAGFNQNAFGNFALSIGCANTPCPESVSVISNGPLCEGEDAEYIISASPNSASSPGATVSYTLDGVAGTVSLDNNGEAVIDVTAPSVGTPASIISLNSIDNQAGTCSTPLSNGASVSVLPPSDPFCSGSSCPPFLILNGTPDPAGLYNAQDYIESTSQINSASGGPVEYNAGTQYIELQPGFEADGSVDFTVEIEGCP